MGNACCSGPDSKPRRRKRESNTAFYSLSRADSDERPSRRGSDKSMSGGIRRSSLHAAYKTPQHSRNSIWHKRIKATSVTEVYSIEDSLESAFPSKLMHVRKSQPNTLTSRSSRLLSLDGQTSQAKGPLLALKRVVRHEEVLANGKVISNSQDVHKECDMHEHLYSSSHPCCLRLLEVFEDKEAYSLILDPVPKSTFLELMIQVTSTVLLHQADDKEDLAAEIISQLARCLARCHDRMVVYRNLGPDTILCLPPPSTRTHRPSDGGALLNNASFSLPSLLASRIQREPSSTLNKQASGPLPSAQIHARLVLSGLDQAVFVHKGNQGCISIRGSTLFAAPEMVRKHLAKGDLAVPFYSKEVDSWALGVLLYTLLAGRFPFLGENEASTAQLILRGGTLPQLVDISQEARSLISSLLEFDPSNRLTAADVLEHPFVTSRTRAKNKAQLEPFSLSTDNGEESDLHEKWRRKSHQLWSALSSLRTVYQQALQFCNSIFPLHRLIATLDTFYSMLLRQPQLQALKVSIDEIFDFVHEETTLDSSVIRGVVEEMMPGLSCIKDVFLLLASITQLASESYDGLQITVVHSLQSYSKALEGSISNREILEIITEGLSDSLAPEPPVSPAPITEASQSPMSILVPQPPLSPPPAQTQRSRLQVSTSSTSLIQLTNANANNPQPQPSTIISGPRSSSLASPPTSSLESSLPSPPPLILSPSSREAPSRNASSTSKINRPTLTLEGQLEIHQPPGEATILSENSGSFKKIDLAPMSPKRKVISNRVSEARRNSFTQPKSSKMVAVGRYSGSGPMSGPLLFMQPDEQRALSAARLFQNPLCEDEPDAVGGTTKPLTPRGTISTAWG